MVNADLQGTSFSSSNAASGQVFQQEIHLGPLHAIHLGQFRHTDISDGIMAVEE